MNNDINSLSTILPTSPTNYGMMPNGSVSPPLNMSMVINDPSEIIEYNNELSYWSKRTKDIEKYSNLSPEQKQTLRELNQKILDVKKILTSQQSILKSSNEFIKSKPISIPNNQSRSLTNSDNKISDNKSSDFRNSDSYKHSNPGSPREEFSGSESSSKSNSRRNSGRLRKELTNKIKRMNSDDDETRLGVALMKAMKFLEQDQEQQRK